MKGITTDFILNTGGEFHFYYQGEYITSNDWGATDITQRHGAWIGNRYDRINNTLSYGLDGGVCRGLSAAYLVAGRDWGKFNAYLNRNEGKGLVRGVMNFQHELIKNNNYEKNDRVFNEILKIHHVNSIKKNHILQVNRYMNVGEEVLKNILTGYGYNIGVQGDFGWHAVAMRVESGSIKLFDPNLGEVTYPYFKGRSLGMVSFLKHVLCEYYSSFHTIYIQRYSLR